MNFANRRFTRSALTRAACIVLAAAGADAAAGETWHPKPVPRGHTGPVEINVQVVDVSTPADRPLASAARRKTAAAATVNSVPGGHYVMLVGYSDAPAVIADAFVGTNFDRTMLIEAIDAMQLDRAAGDPDGLEHFVLDLRSKATREFAPRSVSMRIDVLTDNAGSAAHGRGLDVLAGRRTTRAELGGGLHQYTLDFNSPAVAAGGSSDGAATALVLAALCAAALVGTACGLVRLRAARRHRLRSAGGTRASNGAAEASFLPTAFVIAQFAVGGDGSARAVQAPKEIACAPGIPVRIGWDASCAYRLEGPGGAEPVCSITCDVHGGAVLTEPAEGLVVDGRPAADGHLMDPAATHNLVLGDVEVRIGPAMAIARDVRDLYFRRDPAATTNATPSRRRNAIASPTIPSRPLGRIE